MQWTKPDFEQICLAGEVTAYVNTDDSQVTDHIPHKADVLSASQNETGRDGSL